MDPPFAIRVLWHQYSHFDSTFHLSLGFHYTLKQYGGWIRPVQLRCHYSTVKCVISLHETFQMWFPVLTNGGGSSPCNTDTIFTVFTISFKSAITLLFRYACLPQEQPMDPTPHWFLIIEFTTWSWLLIFFTDSHTILSTHRVHGTSAAWCFCGSIVQWYTGSGVSLPCPSPLKLLCCRCFLNFRRVSDLHVPCYWCEMLQGMGYPPRFWKNVFFFSDSRFVIRAIYIPCLFQPLPRW